MKSSTRGRSLHSPGCTMLLFCNIAARSASVKYVTLLNPTANAMVDTNRVA